MLHEISELRTMRSRAAAAVIVFLLGVLLFASGRLLLSNVYRTKVIRNFKKVETEGLLLYGKRKHRLKTVEGDSHMYITDEDTRIGGIEMNVLLMYKPRGNQERTVEVYYDTGDGFSETQYVQVRLKKGANRVFFDTLLPVHRVRIDFFNSVNCRLRFDSMVLNPTGSGNLWSFAVLAFTALLFFALLSTGTGRHGFALSAVVWLLLALSAGIPYLRCVRETAEMNQALLVLGAPAVLLAGALLMKEGPAKERFFCFAILLCAFAFYAWWACHCPYADGPDEAMHHDVVYYIARHGTIPAGYEREIRNEIWGFSYAYLPILPFIIGGYLEFFAIRLAGLNNFFQIVLIARFVSVVCGTVTVLFSWRLAKLLFRGRPIRYLVPCIVAFLPEMAFLNTYVNSDSMAIMTTAVILYYWVSGCEYNWRVRDCVGLSVGMALCALTYYNCYGFILLSIPVFFYTVWVGGKSRREVVRLTALIVGLTFLLCGWWFIRNLLLYDGDLLGRTALNRNAEIYAAEGYKPSQIMSPQRLGVGIRTFLFGEEWQWVKLTIGSFIAMFSHYLLRARMRVYIGFALFFGTGGALALLGRILLGRDGTGLVNYDRKRRCLRLCMLAAVLIVLALAFYYSYTVDFQPQGRYIMPCIVPLACLTASGFGQIGALWARLRHREENRACGIRTAVLSSAFCIFMLLNILLDTIFSYYIG